jgi:hypothetical protein
MARIVRARAAGTSESRCPRGAEEREPRIGARPLETARFQIEDIQAAYVARSVA